MKKTRHFIGASPLITDRNNVPILFTTDATSENQGRKAIQRGMNKKRGYIPEAFVPMDFKEVKTSSAQ